MPSAKENLEQISQLQNDLRTLAGEVAALRVQLGDHAGRIEEMEVAKPPELRRLTLDAVQSAISTDPYARFEVLKDWAKGFNDLRGGSVVRADHFPHLVDYVRAGLMLGVPTDQAKVIARMRHEAEARAEAALAETKLAEAATARASAEAAAARAAAVNVGHTTPTAIVEDDANLDF
jgi:hypothetical protein